MQRKQSIKVRVSADQNYYITERRERIRIPEEEKIPCPVPDCKAPVYHRCNTTGRYPYHLDRVKAAARQKALAAQEAELMLPEMP